MPSRCAPNTGILYKAMVNHSNGGLTELPLLDCVADMQLVFAMDQDDDPTTFDTYGDLPTLTAEQVRTRVKEVRVYILAHEGQSDTFYTYPNATITLTDPDAGLQNTIDLNNLSGSTYVNYRWKIYTMVIKPFNLR